MEIRVQFHCSQFIGFVVQVGVRNDDIKNPITKWPFEGRFKVTIIDRRNKCHIFESRAIKLQPLSVPKETEKNILMNALL